jgi:hypothetical protein
MPRGDLVVNHLLASRDEIVAAWPGPGPQRSAVPNSRSAWTARASAVIAASQLGGESC